MLVEIGANVVRHSKYVTYQMAEVATRRAFFAAIVQRLRLFGLPSLLPRPG